MCLLILLYYIFSFNTNSTLQTETQVSVHLDMDVNDHSYHGIEILDDCGDIEDDDSITDTYSNTDVATNSNYVTCEFEDNVESNLSHEEIEFYSKIHPSKRVFISSDNAVDHGEIYDLYVCEILQVKITKDKYVYYLLKYDASEAGRKRPPFWLPQWKVVYQDNYGRSLHTSGRVLSQRTSLPTKRYFDESSEITEYYKRRKEFENLTIVCGDSDESKRIKLFEICNQIYDHAQANNTTVLAGYGPYLTEDHVVRVLIHYSMRNPELDKYHRNINSKSIEALNHQKMLHMLECKFFYIVYIFLHEFMWLFHYRTTSTIEGATNVSNNRQCAFGVGMLCESYNQCRNCIRGLRGKKVEKRLTSTMGYGLFACENIPKDTYIIRYIGKQEQTFDPLDCSYVAKVTYKNQKNEDVAFYIDAKKTKSIAKFANHSCVPNAVFSKMIVSETKKPFLMIKSITDISNGDEILTNYGDEYERMLRNVGGCKCVQCINKKPSAV